jgi:cutinase
MKFSISASLIAALAALSIASPLPADADADITLERRQLISADDLKNGDCKPVAFIFARGSTEAGNMVLPFSFPFPFLRPPQTPLLTTEAP